MAIGITGTTRQQNVAYLTVAEYKSAPTAIDYNNLVMNSTDADVQDAELKNVILRASSWIDNHCDQTLAATAVTEKMRSRMKNNGFISIKPRFNPIVSLSNFEYGITPNQMVTYPDCSQAWIEDQSIQIPFTNLSYSTQGPLQFGLPTIPRAQVYCSLSYTHGYAIGLLASNASIGATSITLNNGVGILAGESLVIYDGKSTETITVDASYTFGSTTIPLTAGLRFAHTAGVGVDGLPYAIKQAAILAVTSFLKIRGDGSMTMGVGNTPAIAQFDNPSNDNDLEMAKQLLDRYRRIR